MVTKGGRHAVDHEVLPEGGSNFAAAVPHLQLQDTWMNLTFTIGRSAWLIHAVSYQYLRRFGE